MKKFGVIVLVVCMVFVLGGCNQSMIKVLNSNISEYCEDYYIGETQDYYIELFDGEREEPYYLDGVSEKKQRYCLIVVTPKNEAELKEDMEYCVELNDKTVEGGLNLSPFDNTMSSEMELELGKEDNIFVYIKLDTSTQVSKMNCVSKDFALQWQDVVNTTYEKLSEDVDTLLSTHKSMECYVQVINKSMEIGKYYWCITMIFDNADKYSCIVDPMSAEILAKNL